ncbi:restriction endonuclease subunit S [Aliarcobacter butzleri]|uniref:restriction endonuclease subunit S n=1 Tax=Aliarcobacter butzleri TaxID=28197 RepID=UPI00263EAAF2|nr:restriction endonuclease subunit S [Aliarcobacter butzleri]MDN5058242.1 restriction endonuclease subunit S [Aliarcobacter butzleri]
MSKFELSSEVNSEKCFILNRSEIEIRLDPFFYIPSIKKLEEQVKSKGSIPLRKFIEKISSGATPKTAEKEKYYSDAENGIPFLRVQNLSPTGFLEIENCKYINEETHNNYLKRSQVNGGNLLVKITGVGRMAVASVAPDDFVGNTNQHMVVIKTKDKNISHLLASYLNSDIGEKLASRRATGGTRPALDYPALLSIPIIYDEKILEIHNDAIAKKQQKEQEAKELLDSIDKYLLDELGITLPEVDKALEKRIFEVRFNEISGNRFDPDYKIKMNNLENLTWSFSLIELRDVIIGNSQYGANETAQSPKSENDIRYIRITDIDELGLLKENDWKTVSKIEEQYFLNFNDILFARSGSVGKCYIHKNIDKKSIFAGYLIRFVLNEEKINPDYLFFYCNSSIYRYWVSAIERPAVQSNINSEEYKSLKIPLPPIEKQNEIAKHIQTIRDKAKQLQNEAKQALEDAKIEVEKLILGESWKL